MSNDTSNIGADSGTRKISYKPNPYKECKGHFYGTSIELDELKIGCGSTESDIKLENITINSCGNTIIFGCDMVDGKNLLQTEGSKLPFIITFKKSFLKKARIIVGGNNIAQTWKDPEAVIERLRTILATIGYGADNKIPMKMRDDAKKLLKTINNPRDVIVNSPSIF